MNRRFVRAVGSFTGILALVTSAAAAQTGVLSGAIFDQTNNVGLAGVTVKVPGTALIATTGKDGRFTIADVPAGTREIEAVRTGYHPYRLSRLRVVENDTAFIYLALAVAPFEATPSTNLRTETVLGPLSQNAPMYILDGVVIPPGSMPDLIPDRVETIEIIKGAAAAALYGERGANGVIIVRTKR